MANNKDFKVKNGIQPTVYNEGVGTVVSGSEGYYLAGAEFDNVTASISQAGDERGLTFSTDGTKFYIIDGNTPQSVYQYNLSTAWDLSTSSYSNNSFNISSQETQPTGIAFKSDGTKMYITGYTGDDVNEYTLSTAWDVSTASYSQVFSVSSQLLQPADIAFKSDGTEMYVSGYNASTEKRIYQYTLSTAWDVSTASYSSKTTTLLEFDGIHFKSDGTELFVVGNFTDTVYKYTLSTAWDISTATSSGTSFSVSSQDIIPYGLAFKDDGTKMYVMGVVGTDVNQYSTVQTTASLDLSTGAVFDYTPTSDVQVTVSNPAASGTVSSATLLLGGAEATGVGSTFSTTLYTGNGSTQTITNNIDLATDGGLVWIKNRTGENHGLVDTEVNGLLFSNLTNAANTGITHTFNSDGFTVGSSGAMNDSPDAHVSWTFKKQSSFFDVVTYTGTGTAQNISHSLGDTVGTLIVKRTDSADNWTVWHRGVNSGSGSSFLNLNLDSAYSNSATRWNSTAPTSTQFSVGTHASVNASGGTYVAYLFAHDTSADSIIKCDSYTGNGSTTGPEINLGWEPQWLLTKRASGGSGLWRIVDNVRGIGPNSNTFRLWPNVNYAEDGGAASTDFTSTGFKLTDNVAEINTNGSEYLYMAIRNPYIPTITYDTDLEWSGGTAPTAPAEGETDVITISTRDGGTTYQAIQAIDGAK